MATLAGSAACRERSGRSEPPFGVVLSYSGMHPRRFWAVAGPEPLKSNRQGSGLSSGAEENPREPQRVEPGGR